VISAVLPDLQEVVDSARCVIPGVVYYIRVGELIKIGYTRDLDQRLRAYPPDAELLATEIGNELIEQAGHAQFGDLLAARAEWFHPGPALLAHIEALTR
jgi:hypothetical protein